MLVQRDTNCDKIKDQEKIRINQKCNRKHSFSVVVALLLSIIYHYQSCLIWRRIESSFRSRNTDCGRTRSYVSGGFGEDAIKAASFSQCSSHADSLSGRPLAPTAATR